MQAQPKMTSSLFLDNLTDTERTVADRLLKLATETDRYEGYAEPHALQVAQLATELATMLGLHGLDATALKFAALGHDLGQRSLKRDYLLRPGALTWEEQLDLWRHPILGEQEAAELKLPRQSQLLIRWHHEAWNGLGYPDGLAGTAIPLGARILRVADTYTALRATRPQRAALDEAAADNFIAQQAGVECDPQVVQALLTYLTNERALREQNTESRSQELIAIEDEREFLSATTPASIEWTGEWTGGAADDLAANPPTERVAPPTGKVVEPDVPVDTSALGVDTNPFGIPAKVIAPSANAVDHVTGELVEASPVDRAASAPAESLPLQSLTPTVTIIQQTGLLAVPAERPDEVPAATPETKFETTPDANREAGRGALPLPVEQSSVPPRLTDELLELPSSYLRVPKGAQKYLDDAVLPELNMPTKMPAWARLASDQEVTVSVPAGDVDPQSKDLSTDDVPAGGQGQ